MFPLSDVAAGGRFLWSLPGFLRRPISVEEARATLRRRLERREADFLDLARQAVYACPWSPYRQLLALAGCEYGDLKSAVEREGLEGALRILFRQGVYLSVDEYKGKRPVVRGSAQMTVAPDGLRNPCSAPHLATQTSGSRGAPTSVLTDLGFIRDCAVDTCLDLDAKGGGGWLKAVWETPGAGVFRVLKYSAFGAPVARWYSQVEPAASGLHPSYRWRVRVLSWGGLLSRVGLPRPEHVPLDDPLPIVHWMADELRAGRTPHLRTFPSSAVRVCLAALDAGVDLQGALFMMSGEPITAARLAAVRSVGADAWPRYGSMDTGPIGYGCLAPDAPDDVHLVQDLHAVVQPEPDGIASAMPRLSLLISGLRATAPLILLNVSLGDQAEASSRACGCPLERLGWATHLHNIRSYEKLTAGGMTFLDTDVIQVLEDILPARFGGGPTDYQLLEEEDHDGQPRLRLLVNPTIGALDGRAVAEAFLDAIGPGSGSGRMMALQWRQAGLLRVERRAPQATTSGKVLHLHQPRREHAVGLRSPPEAHPNPF
jgi:hypothetical protein